MNSNTLQLTLQVKDDGTVVIDKAAGKIKDLEGETQKGTKGLGSFSEGWAATTAKITGFIAAGYGAYKMIDSFISEAAEAEAIENRLKFALETTGYSWSAAKSAVDEFATSIQANTRFSDEQARQSLTDMMMYTQDFGKAQMGAKLAMDMSIRTGQDLGSTNRLIGMAMSGNVEMLGRYIPEFKNLDATLGANATQAQKAEYALKILQQKFGGTAQADLDSYSGKVAQFKNQWGDLKEEIGNKTLPILGDLLGILTKVSQRLALGVGGGIEKAQLEFQLKAWEQRYEILKEQPGFEAEVLECEEKIWAINEKLAVLYEKIGEDRKKLAAETKGDTFPETKGLTDIQKLIIAGEQELAQTRIDAILAVYSVQAEKDQESVKMHEYAQGKILEGEEIFKQERIDAILAVYTVHEEQNKKDIANAADRLTAYRDLYKDLKGYEGDYYESSKAIVLKQGEDYRTLLIDKNTSAEDAARIEILLAERTAYELRKLDEEKVLRSNNFFAGMKVQMDQNIREQTTWGQAGADVIKKFSVDAQGQLSDNLFNFMTGKFDKLSLDWNSLWEGMLRTFTDKIAEMAVTAAAAEIFDWFDIGWIFAAEGIWKLQGAGKEGIPVIAHPGETILPADLAEQFRGMGGDSFADVRGMVEGKGIGLVQAISMLQNVPATILESIVGLEPGSRIGYSVLSAVSKAAGLSPIFGIPAGLLGMLVADQIIGYLQDLSTSKTMTTWSSSVEEAAETHGRGYTAYGYFGLSAQEAADAAAANAATYADIAQEAADAAAANASYGDSGYGWGGSEQGFKRGAIFKGPESGYWTKPLKLHGEEAIVPLKNGESNLAELVAEVKQLREDLKRVNFVIAKNTGKMAKVLSRFDDDGLPPERVLS